MKLSTAWLRELVDHDLSPEALAERLTMAGLEVESITPWGRFDDVVVARIEKVEKHPNADRLSLCQVDAGGGELRSIVCGAPGLVDGQLAPLALPGAVIGDTKIRVGKIRGERSEGMMLSERELGLSEDHGGLAALPDEARPGQALSEALRTEDVILELGITPNRGDCLSVLGIAREVAALTGAPLRLPATELEEGGASTADRITIEIADPELCARYVGRSISGAAIGPSPAWMRSRLQSVGVRAINVVVDVTNYVMLELGQPLHAFDAATLEGNRIVVRRAGDTRRLATLDGVERELEADDLVIADASRPVALAGVMGGETTAVGPETSEILLEAAWFAPSAIRRTSRRLGLISESSYRFERTVDVEGVVRASDRAAHLLERLAGATVGRGRVDVYPRPHEAVIVPVRTARVNALLGTTFSDDEVAGWLARVADGVESAGGVHRCGAPSHRADLSREADFIEEIARLAGYDTIPDSLPRIAMAPAVEAPSAEIVRRTRDALLRVGLTEMVTLRFAAEAWNERVPGLAPAGRRPVVVVNPISAEASQMRMSLLPGLLVAAEHNRRQGALGCRAFEVGQAFWAGEGDAPAEPRLAAGVLRGAHAPEAYGRSERAEGFFDAKGAVEALLEAVAAPAVTWSREGVPSFLHPGKAAAVLVAGVRVGVVGELHPETLRAVDLDGPIAVFEVDLDCLAETAFGSVAVRPLSRFPVVTRDVALVAPEDFESGEVPATIAEHPELLVEDVRLFDVYRGDPVPPGKKSLAYAISYRHADRTLTDDEASELHQNLLNTLRTSLGVELRG